MVNISKNEPTPTNLEYFNYLYLFGFECEEWTTATVKFQRTSAFRILSYHLAVDPNRYYAQASTYSQFFTDFKY
jgi:hypothetical protein